MNKIQFKLLFAFILIINMISCKAQNLPLNTAFSTIPNGAYLKDTNNELVPYVGTYKANFNGNEITLFITKQENKLEESAQKNYYMDALIVKYIVKNSTGTILQDTQNNNLYNIELYSIGTNPNKNAITFYYSGTNCSVGWGDIYLKKLNTAQISWEYRPDDIVTTADKCPPSLNTTIYLPETKDLIFTKQ
ncbi:hypothetical protein CHRY9390_00355 [Chryseobacterium aquaeductus]|uniref:DUF6705 domain-containing protein n=1 Tax=Chryseobacterium aquaeductus TaxID=2675056 RepID=A0A9N8QR78_9FLAO|nr:DUF6705 family protein [Chryseobacterium aquaeductus]CAA7329714.1 hypothetical protein CHRY9390_00355 [Chryseobacterium potabilaquae]CAD7798568.1 hypothetical protein CHRY9390_00355 [Chryseobacterium aquaeductus]